MNLASAEANPGRDIVEERNVMQARDHLGVDRIAAQRDQMAQETEDSVLKRDQYSPSDMSRVHVGIGIGAAVAGIILGALLALVCVRSTNRKNTDVEMKSPTRRSPDKTRRQEAEAQRVSYISSIYPHESASCCYPEAPPPRLSAKTYATDFAVADRQIWTNHLQTPRHEDTRTQPAREQTQMDSRWFL
ncbi:hypothetical protein M426DRAFT_14542 [Hypoxylon sp. CI-4A]|nr:hypothetical protein M426DRAFT_14542 [Hypoxylon sp. CI-4A]